MSCCRFHESCRWRALPDDRLTGRLPFAPPGTPRRYARDREVDVRHVLLDLTVDLEGRKLAGTVTHRLTPLRPGVARLGLDAVELDITAVTLDGRDVGFRHDGRRLVVELSEPLAEGRESALAVRYACVPRRGFYFVGPDQLHPDRPVHAWSQGQDEDSRHWWPVHDSPNEKATTELIARVPLGLVAISNGRLVGTREEGGRTAWHWSQEKPHVPYLVTLAVGPFEKLEQEADGLPLTTWFLPGREAEARRCVARTPDMVRLFARRTGVPYPWAKYDQVFVSEFIFGGMENTSATTLTDLAMPDERAALDYTHAEDLVAHELAHQWFGDLVTCRDWSQAWLNEGFATWAEILWREEADGEDEAWMLRRELGEQYFEEDRDHYRRPIVCRSYDEPIELFDAHLYQKAAWVVSMLRDELGDEVFWRALQRYLTRHAAGSVETADLRRAIEDASGRNLEAFFEQWVESAGHPVLSLESRWDEERRELVLEVGQQQEGEQVPEAFRAGVEVGLLVGGHWRVERLEISRRRQSFAWPLSEEPACAAFDPRARLLAEVEWKRPAGPLCEVLARAPWAPARAEAAGALGRDGSRRAVLALGAALAGDAAWGVRAAAAAALGEIRTEAAREALLPGLADRHPKARRAVVTALGAFRDDAAFAALAEVLRAGDASCFVEAEAARSLGKTRRAGALAALADALETKTGTWNETVRAGVLGGLGHVAWEEREGAVAALLGWTGRDRFIRCRTAATGALARVGEGSDRARERLEELTEDADFRVLVAAADGLGRLGDRRSRGALQRLADTALDGRARRAARDAVRRLGTGGAGRLAKLADEVERLAAEERKLRERLERLESRREPGRGAGPGGPEGPGGPGGPEGPEGPDPSGDPGRREA
jgi:aminopeptidase N